MKSLPLILALACLAVSCVTTEEQATRPQPIPTQHQVSAESGRGIPYFTKYERNSVRPAMKDGPRLVERKNCLPAFHDYEKAQPGRHDTDFRR